MGLALLRRAPTPPHALYREPCACAILERPTASWSSASPAPATAPVRGGSAYGATIYGTSSPYPPRGLSAYGISSRAGLHHLRRRRMWRTRGMAAIVFSGLLLLVAAVLSQPGPSPGERSPILQTVHPAQVVIVQEDTLPPVMHRIAQCESRGQHWTKQGRVVRGKQNRHDTGLFQINTIVWGKKAQDLGYDIYTRRATRAWHAISLKTTGLCRGRVQRCAGIA